MLSKEEKEALLEKVEPCRMFWDRFYITDEGQVFTCNDETGQSAEEVYQAWLELKENPPKPKPTQMELLQSQFMRYFVIVILPNNIFPFIVISR